MAADTTAVPSPSAGAPNLTPESTAPSTGLLPRHLPALDGIRGLAVVAVVLFHLGHLRAPGGWLGVDVFFALSGFLITALLLAERDRTGRISLRGFWQRRIRRLGPALVVALLVICALALLRDPEPQRHAVGRDTLWTLAYVVNWAQAIPAHGTSVAPELRHLWSLGVEEQGYLLWPPLLVALLSRSRAAERAGQLAVLAAAGTLASAITMWVLQVRGVPLDRLYYGSDTHVQPLLAGAALAAGLHAAGPRRTRWADALQPLGWIGFGGLVFAVLRLSSGEPRLYRGGFLLLALAVLAVLAAVTLRPSGLLARGLSLAPLRLLGQRSYGIYLWHWPVICWLTGPGTGLSRGHLALLRIVVTLVVADLSYRLIESPVSSHRARTFSWPVRAASVVTTIGLAASGLALMLAY